VITGAMRAGHLRNFVRRVEPRGGREVEAYFHHEHGVSVSGRVSSKMAAIHAAAELAKKVPGWFWHHWTGNPGHKGEGVTERERPSLFEAGLVQDRRHRRETGMSVVIVSAN